ncbi:MAG: hypothetical protein JRF25_00990 [Deltaproteobacteria bacterium]|nr:hypothetical protein [Deltaproteobacteria bacterium]
MNLNDVQAIWTGNILYLIILIVVAEVFLYLARTPAHRFIYSLCRLLHNNFRLMARSVLLTEKRVIRRNREVLLTAGEKSVERLIEQEFNRVDSVLKRDLGGFPSVQRALADKVSHIDENYLESSELEPPPPVWVNAVKSVAKISSGGDAAVANILTEIHKTTENQFKYSVDEYRKATSARLSKLTKMAPDWRKVGRLLEEVGKKFDGLNDRAKILDNLMKEYRQNRAKTDKAERLLSSSSITHFFISGFVLLVAIGGAMINFQLIALPMSEMVGGGSYIGNLKIANVAAMVIILVEIAMGLFLMESLRITNLFPIIGQMDDKMRVRMIWVTFTILFILACIESSLAFMRDRIAADLHALRLSLADVEMDQQVTSIIPTIGQMVMGFILPFALTFVAIPLESFIYSARTVFGIILAAGIRWFAFALRLIGNLFLYMGGLIVGFYDVLINPLLWIENVLIKKQEDKGKNKEKAS